MLARQKRRRFADQVRQRVHVIVERLELAGEGVTQHLVEPALLGLAGKERDAHLLRGFNVGRQFRQHRDAARDVKAADADRQLGVEERLCQIDRARKLIGLDTNKSDQTAAAFTLDQADDVAGLNPPVGLIICVEPHFDAGTQHLAPPRVFRERIQASQRIRWDRRPQPLDRVAVVVIMRRLDHHEVEQRRSPIDGRIRHSYSCPQPFAAANSGQNALFGSISRILRRLPPAITINRDFHPVSNEMRRTTG